MSISDRTVEAIVTGVVGILITLALRWGLRVSFGHYLERIETKRTPAEVARMRTRLTVLQRVIVALLFAIVVWSVLTIFPATHAFARALLASGAILALFAGLAFSTPLSNIGAGILLALTQPVRLGDRITVSDVTGRAVEITLIHTVLMTDDGRRVFVPNNQIASSVVVNRSIDDPRRTVTVQLPISLRASVDSARQAVVDAAEGVGQNGPVDLTVVLSELTDSIAWLTVTARVAAGSDTVALASELRERGLAALAREELLPA
jgi:small-conductance mechanosensitive channel